MAAKPKWKCNKSKFEATKGRKKNQEKTKTKADKVQARNNARNQEPKNRRKINKRIGHRETGTQGQNCTGTRTRPGGT